MNAGSSSRIGNNGFSHGTRKNFFAGASSRTARHRRIVRGQNYPAYGFCNRSEDILQLFGSACDALGLRWRRSSQMRISIARRREVARLDTLLGYTERRL